MNAIPSLLEDAAVWAMPSARAATPSGLSPGRGISAKNSQFLDILAKTPAGPSCQHRISALCVGIAIALSGCTPEQKWPVEYGVLRTRIFQDCMDRASKVTPATIADRGSWSEVVGQCGDQAFYQANTCDDPKACLAQLNASAIEARSAETTGSARKGESATAESRDAQGEQS